MTGDATAQRERAKYQRTWSDPVYRHACHSLSLWHERRDLFPAEFRTALDIGCGTGRLAAEWLASGIDARAIDIADNCLDPAAAGALGDRFHVGCLWSMMPAWASRFDFGICTDVMEHIPPEHVEETLRHIYHCCDEVLFKIAHTPNQLGDDVLHLTLQPPSWWVAQMNAIGGYAEFVGIQMRSGNEDSLIRWTIGDRRLAHRHCRVIGSAPDTDIPAPSPNVAVVAANGGAALALKAGFNIDVLATTSYLLRGMDPSASAALTLQSMRGIYARSLWVDTKCGPIGAVDLDRCDIRYYDELRCVSPDLRSRIVRAAIASDLWVSTGIFAACLAVVSGASRVSLHGVSLSPGHAGQPASVPSRRDHVDEDRAALRILFSRGVRVSPALAREVSS